VRWVRLIDLSHVLFLDDDIIEPEAPEPLDYHKIACTRRRKLDETDSSAALVHTQEHSRSEERFIHEDRHEELIYGRRLAVFILIQDCSASCLGYRRAH